MLETCECFDDCRREYMKAEIADEALPGIVGRANDEALEYQNNVRTRARSQANRAQ